MTLSNDKGRQLKLHEKGHVEDPFLDQLADLGWDVVRLQQGQAPSESFRSSFDEVVLRPKLDEALRTINPFLREEQVAEAARRVTHFPQSSLMENNRQVSDLLLENTSVAVNTEREIRTVGFWQSTPAQKRLGADIQAILLSERFAGLPNVFAKCKTLVSHRTEWARARSSRDRQRIVAWN